MFFKFFSKNNKYLQIAPDAGVRQLNRDTFEVKLREKIAVIEAEYIGGDYTRDIYDELLVQWQSPHNQEIFSDEDRTEIVRILKEFFDKTGETYYP